MLDYLVVGLGLAGLSFCETLERNNKTFAVLNDDSQQASKVAGGMYNPIILKRFSMAWKASEQLSEMRPFYSQLEKKLGSKFNEKLQVMRRFASVEEQNNWFEAADDHRLKAFLDTEIHPNKNHSIDAPYGYGAVLETGKIHVSKLLSLYEANLNTNGNLISTTFDFDKLSVAKEGLSYGELKAKRIVFAEGFGLKQNPYLVGKHPNHDNLFVLNGLGSRGVMIAPWASKHLFDFIEHQIPLAAEMDCSRFTKRYFLV